MSMASDLTSCKHCETTAACQLAAVTKGLVQHAACCNIRCSSPHAQAVWTAPGLSVIVRSVTTWIAACAPIHVEWWG